MTPRTALSRRTALATAALAPVGLAGCDLDPPQEADPGEDPSGGVTTAPDADAVLVAGVVAAIAAAEPVVAAARTAVPAAASVLTALEEVHARHRELLEEAAPDVSVPPAPETGVTARPAVALAAVRRAERRVRAEVDRASLQASSGDLARVLAVVAGSLAQHAAALDAVTGPGAAP